MDFEIETQWGRCQIKKQGNLPFDVLAFDCHGALQKTKITYPKCF
jgi:hypothetical protein